MKKRKIGFLITGTRITFEGKKEILTPVFIQGDDTVTFSLKLNCIYPKKNIKQYKKNIKITLDS